MPLVETSRRTTTSSRSSAAATPYLQHLREKNRKQRTPVTTCGVGHNRKKAAASVVGRRDQDTGCYRRRFGRSSSNIIGEGNINVPARRSRSSSSTTRRGGPCCGKSDKAFGTTNNKNGQDDDRNGTCSSTVVIKKTSVVPFHSTPFNSTEEEEYLCCEPADISCSSTYATYESSSSSSSDESAGGGCPPVDESCSYNQSSEVRKRYVEHEENLIQEESSSVTLTRRRTAAAGGIRRPHPDRTTTTTPPCPVLDRETETEQQVAAARRRERKSRDTGRSTSTRATSQLDLLCNHLLKVRDDDDDDDSFVALERLIDETSECWQKATKCTGTNNNILNSSSVVITTSPPCPMNASKRTMSLAPVIRADDKVKEIEQSCTSIIPRSSQQRIVRTTTTPQLNVQGTSTSAARSTEPEMGDHPPNHNCTCSKAWKEEVQEMMVRQQSEIDNLRSKLELHLQRQEETTTHHHQEGVQQLPTSADYDDDDYNFDARSFQPFEQIDDIPVDQSAFLEQNSIPIEQIEVCDDYISFTSGLTNLHHPDLTSGCVVRGGGGNVRGARCSADAGGPCSSSNFHLSKKAAASSSTARNRPESASYSGGRDSRPVVEPHHDAHHHVRGMDLELIAKDGSKRHARYTGTVHNGYATGTGVLLFKETGDTYVGEVVNGEMHGQGVYTFKKKTRNAYKVLEGTFEHNVYTGWEPKTLYYRGEREASWSRALVLLSCKEDRRANSTSERWADRAVVEKLLEESSQGVWI